MSEDTRMLDLTEVTSKNVREVLDRVVEALTERGYNPVNQIVGYIISGDLGYISSYKEARNMISKIDRTALATELLKTYLKSDNK